MKQPMCGLTIDHNYRIGGTVKAGDLIARIDLVRRLLGNTIPIKQIGTCTFAFDPSHKEHVFAAIDSLREAPDLSLLEYTFFMFELLDEEYELWRRQRDLDLTLACGDEEEADGESSFSMASVTV